MIKGVAISSFVRLDEDEVFEREFHISHTTQLRFSAKAIAAIVAGLALCVIPGVVLLAYFALRTLKISRGYASLTNKRVIYYEYNTHPEENYRRVLSLHLEDLTAMVIEIDRGLISESFHMRLNSSKRAIAVGAHGFLGIWGLFGSESTLEPGPDALDFIRDITGAVARRKFRPEVFRTSEFQG